MDSADTTSATATADSSTSTESGSAESQRSKRGSGTTRGRRSAKATSTPLATPPPALDDIKAQVESYLEGDAGEKLLMSTLKRDLLTSYEILKRDGQDMSINPQHRRAALKQAQEIAELLIQLAKNG